MIDLTSVYGFLGSIFLWFQQIGDAIVATPLFQQYGLVILFFWPSFTINLVPIPIEIPIVTLLYAHVNILTIFLVTWTAVYTGSVLFYFIMISGKIIIHRTTMFEEIDESHIIQRHRWIFFSLAPMIYFVGDSMILYAAYKHMPFQNFALPLIIGTFGRTIIAILVGLGLLSIPNFIPHI